MSNLKEVADSRLCEDFDENEMGRLMIIGLWCAHPDYTFEAYNTIRQAVHVLNFEKLHCLFGYWHNIFGTYIFKLNIF